MSERLHISFIITCIGAVFTFLFSPGCANIVPPSGGAIDTIPPLVTRSIPMDSALNVSNNKITLQFNEYIELKNATEEVIISPFPQKQPLIESKLKTITVRFKDSLLPNTTYTIDFGQSVADINEGNIQKNFQHIFATGSYIDSNSLSGRILLAETGKPDSTMWAVLYKKEEDSTVWKENPAYVARINGKGYFRFDRLPPGRYHLYGLKDADGNKRYNQPIESFAFLNDPVMIPEDTLPRKLYAFATEKEKKRTPPEPKKDTKQPVKISYQTNLAGGALDISDTLSITFKEKLTELDKAGVLLYEDTLPAPKNINIQYDSIFKKLSLIYPSNPGGNYRIILSKAFAKDSSGNTLKQNDTIRFRVKKEEEYGSVRIRFKGLDISKKPVLLFYQNDAIKYSYPLAANEFYTRLFKPDTYTIAILLDENGNGTWDAGDYFSSPKKQPELVMAIDKEVVVKENWDNETEIELLGNTP